MINNKKNELSTDLSTGKKKMTQNSSNNILILNKKSELSTGKTQKNAFFRQINNCFLNKKVSYPQIFLRVQNLHWGVVQNLHSKMYNDSKIFFKMRACAGVRLCVRVCACVKGGKG